MVALDPERALHDARGLVASPAKLWQFLGLYHSAFAHLVAGRAVPALDSLSGATRLFAAPPSIAALARRTSAHVHLETVSPRSALSTLEEAGSGAFLDHDHDARHLQALAYARLADDESATRIAATLEPAHEAHIHGELSASIRRLRDASEQVTEDPMSSPRTACLIRYAYARALVRIGSSDEAASVLESLVSNPQAVVHWPVPFVRSLYQLGAIYAATGKRDSAHILFRKFLRLWNDGDLDRLEVDEARQSSMA